MTPIDDHISTWLGRLETELASDDPAVRHDAMADAREHLVAARAELDDDATDADVQRLLEEYGDPVEVAESYRDAERLLHGDRPERAGHADIDHDIVAATPAVAIATSVPGWFGIVRDVDAWARST